MDKYCSGCQSVKLFSDFSKNKRQRDGYANWCKACMKLLWQRPENLLRRRERRMENFAHTLFIETKSRAKANNLDFNLDPSDLLIPEFCPIIKQKLVADISGRTYNTPTVDRKDPNKGYVKGNVFVISWIANRIKSDQNDPELFEAIARYIRG
jgi:hypothetical protein